MEKSPFYYSYLFFYLLTYVLFFFFIFFFILKGLFVYSICDTLFPVKGYDSPADLFSKSEKTVGTEGFFSTGSYSRPDAPAEEKLKLFSYFCSVFPRCFQITGLKLPGNSPKIHSSFGRNMPECSCKHTNDLPKSQTFRQVFDFSGAILERLWKSGEIPPPQCSLPPCVILRLPRPFRARNDTFGEKYYTAKLSFSTPTNIINCRGGS